MGRHKATGGKVTADFKASAPAMHSVNHGEKALLKKGHRVKFDKWDSLELFC